MEQGRVKWVKTTEYTYEGELPVTVVETMEEFPEEQEAVTESGILATAEDYVEIKSPEEPGVIPAEYPGWVIFKALKGILQIYKPRQEDVPPEESLEAKLEYEADEKYRHDHGIDEGGDTPKGELHSEGIEPLPTGETPSSVTAPGSEVSDPKEAA